VEPPDSPDREIKKLTRFGLEASSQDILRKSPDRGLGSKQVDFGGMTSPASATAINSSIEVG
jgi:hypothetical protein